MELMIAKLGGFMLVLTRISAFFLALPVFGWRSIPPRIKVAMTVLLAIFFSMMAAPTVNPAAVGLPRLLLLLGNESVYGFALALIASLVFSAVKLGGRIIERQMGFAMAQILDPLTGERVQPLGSLLEMIFVVLFLSADGHHLLLMTLSRSYEAFPPGQIPQVSALAEGVVKAGSVMFLAGLRLAAPLLAVFLLLMVVLAVLARVVPEMNIFFVSLPLRAGLGLLMTGIFLPLISRFVSEFSDWMGKLVPL